MKRIVGLSILASLLIFNINLIAKTPEIHSFYQEGEFVLDGKIDDWGDMAIYDEKTGIMINMSNDHEFVYVKVRIANLMTINRLLLGGFTVWFNDEGKTRKKIGITFPTDTEVSRQIRSQEKVLKGLNKEQIERMQEQNRNELNTKFASGMAIINVINKDDEVIDYRSSCKNEGDLSAMLYMGDFDLLVYESRIPLDMVFSNKEEYLGKKKKAFAMAFEFGKYEDRELKKQSVSIPGDAMLRELDVRYQSKIQSRMEGMGTYPPMDTWYKKAYLSNGN